MSDSPFDMFGGDFLKNARPAATAKPKPEKGLPWNAKVIDDEYYVPLSQVAELLKQNDVLPAVRKGLENRIQIQKDFIAKRR